MNWTSVFCVYYVHASKRCAILLPESKTEILVRKEKVKTYNGYFTARIQLRVTKSELECTYISLDLTDLVTSHWCSDIARVRLNWPVWFFFWTCFHHDERFPEINNYLMFINSIYLSFVLPLLLMLEMPIMKHNNACKSREYSCV